MARKPQAKASAATDPVEVTCVAPFTHERTVFRPGRRYTVSARVLKAGGAAFQKTPGRVG